MSEPRMNSLGFYCVFLLCALERRARDDRQTDSFYPPEQRRQKEERDKQTVRAEGPMSIRMLTPMSSQLCPDARRTAGMEVSIVALICIRSTFLPLFSFVIRPHSKDGKCAEFVIRSSIFQQSGGIKGGRNNVWTLSSVFWRCCRHADGS